MKRLRKKKRALGFNKTCPECRGIKSVQAITCMSCWRKKLVSQYGSEKNGLLRNPCECCKTYPAGKTGFCIRCLKEHGWSKASDLKRELILSNLRDNKDVLLPSVVTLDDIKRLRLSGQGVEAERALREYQKNKLENKYQLQREIHNQVAKANKIRENRREHDIHTENVGFSDEKKI